MTKAGETNHEGETNQRAHPSYFFLHQTTSLDKLFLQGEKDRGKPQGNRQSYKMKER